MTRVSGGPTDPFTARIDLTLTPAWNRAAALAVTARATDTADARLLLSALGLDKP